MDPISIMTALSLGSTVVGGIMGASAESSKGKAESRSLRLQGQAKGEQYEAASKAYTYKAGLAEMNRRLKLQDADYARWAGESDAETSGMKTKYAIGKTKAIQSGSGLEVNFGTSKAVRDSILKVGQHDQAVIRHNAARKAYGYEVEAASQEAEGVLNKMSAEGSTRAAMFARQGAGEAAEYAESAGDYGAMKSILGATSSVSSKWLQGGSLGMTSTMPSSSFMNNSWGW